MLKPSLLAAALLCACISIPASAQTVRLDNGANDGRQIQAVADRSVGSGTQRHRRMVGVERRHRASRAVHYGAAKGLDPRPRAWCGWWLRHQLGVADRAFNLARKWAGIGTAAHGPAAGVIAVWPHHVGLVTGVPGPGRIVLKSGNDGHQVRERERSTRGIIAYRWPPGSRWARL